MDCGTNKVVAAEKGHVQVNNVAETYVYKRRWYILFAYCLLACTSTAIWNTWGPIAEVSESVFGWTDGTIALLENWGPIGFLIAAPVFSWIVDVKGLRLACITSAVLACAGTGLRCITDQTSTFTWLVHTGQFLNSLAGPVAMGAPPVVAVVWFQPDQRATATAIATSAGAIGVGVSFIIGPLLVPNREKQANHHNCSSLDLSSAASDGEKSVLFDTVRNCTSKNNTAHLIEEARKDIMFLMYLECGVALLCLLLLILYFPTKPPLPPSKSASVERLDFKSGLIGLAKNGTFWMLACTYGVSLGVYYGWQGILDVSLKPHNISQNEAGWLGFYGTVASCVTGLLVARMADILSRHMKWFLVGLYLSGGVCLVVFFLTLYGVISFSEVVIYITYILGNGLLNASVPLFFETACEVTHPVAEGVTNLVMTLVNNIGSLVFLGIQMIPHIGTTWENWALLAAIGSSIPVLLCLKESYNRLEIDSSKTTQ